MRTSWKNVRYLTNDPRTTLLAVAVINLCVMGSANTTTLLLATIITVVLFASVASPRGVIIFLLLEAFFLAFTNKAALLGANSINAFFISISFWMSRFTITATIGLYAIYSISVSQLSAALRQIHVPKNFVSAIMVMLRFPPHRHPRIHSHPRRHETPRHPPERHRQHHPPDAHSAISARAAARRGRPHRR
ncbi:energy-coupling factor transporter transmembrane component T [Corynebacterium argentoratense]|uniref:energy-coupling factor transporter transmembrane component T n=1 Tax=Corynebacterium argentoratense TaxID=42817 RepID=UPI000A4805DE|nr:energy-coupling factor transporter transmembrane component T [Corynebacterium argentoratense]